MKLGEFANLLISQAVSARHRYIVLLNGDYQWQRLTAVSLLENRKAVVISDQAWENTPDNFLQLTNNRAGELLGGESENIIFDASSGFDATALGIVSGSLVAGGLFVIFAPNAQTLSGSRFDHHCQKILATSVHVYQLSATCTPKINSTVVSQAESDEPDFMEQRVAVDAICHVISGQRKRPAVLVADRGRGKSAALGLAADKLFQQGVSRIIVSGRSRQAAGKVFEHCTDSRLIWCSSDELVLSRPHCDLLLIDEAASLPFAMLSELLDHYPRMAMATTVHGYEGTGQGFMLRFAQTLDRKTRGWKKIILKQPIRWHKGDPLEQVTNDLLLQNLDLANIEQPSLKAPDCSFAEINPSSLLTNTSLLKELYSLLTLAHYQTRPSDLVQMLDDDSTRIFVLASTTQVVGAALVKLEGKLSREDSEAIFQGKRRPQGHVLPEIIATHLGQPQAARLSYARIMRIVVHPGKQHQGFGSRLLAEMTNHLGDQVDIVGSHFSMSPVLVRFWRKQGFQPVRIGRSRSVKTGGNSLMVVSSHTKPGSQATRLASADFASNFPLQLLQFLADVRAESVVALIEQNPAFSTPPDGATLDQLAGFCHGSRGIDSVPAALSSLAVYGLYTGELGHPALWVEKILLGKPWAECQDCNGEDGWKAGSRMLKQDALNLMQNQFGEISKQ